MSEQKDRVFVIDENGWSWLTTTLAILLFCAVSIFIGWVIGGAP